MITKEYEYFDDEWMRCLEIIEEAKLAMGDKEHSATEEWMKEMHDKWIHLDSDNSLMEKHESWKPIRQFLWEHYCPDDGIRQKHELDYLPWESDESSDED